MVSSEKTDSSSESEDDCSFVGQTWRLLLGFLTRNIVCGLLFHWSCWGRLQPTTFCKTVSCVMTESISEREDTFFYFSAAAVGFRTCIMWSKKQNTKSNQQIREFCLTFFRPIFHPCTDWSKARFPNAEIEYVLNTATCSRPAAKNLRIMPSTANWIASVQSIMWRRYTILLYIHMFMFCIPLFHLLSWEVQSDVAVSLSLINSAVTASCSRVVLSSLSQSLVIDTFAVIIGESVWYC